MLRAILNKPWRQHPIKRQLYGHLPPIAKITKLDEPDMRNTVGDVGTCSNVTFSRGLLHIDEQRLDDQLESTCADTRCSLEDIPEAIDDREVWLERVWDIRADDAT